MKKYNKLYNYISSDLCEGLYRVQSKLNGKWGFINIKGEEVISCIYDYIQNFNNGFAFVELNKKWGIIDKQGNEIIPCKYNNELRFKNGYARILLDHKYYFIDLNNPSEVMPFTNHIDNISSINDALYYSKYKDTYIIFAGTFIGDLKQFKESVKETYDKGSKPYREYIEVINKLYRMHFRDYIKRDYANKYLNDEKFNNNNTF